MRILALALTSAAWFVSINTVNAADVYRWTDENGVTQYADKPPVNQKFDRVNVRSGTSSASEPVQETKTESAAPATATASSTRAPVDPAVRMERCAAARKNLAALRSGLEVTGEFDGQTRALTPEELTVQRERNERIEKQNCSPA